MIAPALILTPMTVKWKTYFRTRHDSSNTLRLHSRIVPPLPFRMTADRGHGRQIAGSASIMPAHPTKLAPDWPHSSNSNSDSRKLGHFETILERSSTLTEGSANALMDRDTPDI